MHRDPVDRTSRAGIVIYQRGGPFPVNRYFIRYKLALVVRAAGAVPACIIAQSAENSVGTAFKNSESGDPCKGGYIPGLSHMAGDPVQDKHIAIPVTAVIEKTGNDLSSKGKMLVLEQQAALQNADNEVSFFRRKTRTSGCSDRAKGSAKIEMMRTPSDKSRSSEPIAQRALA